MTWVWARVKSEALSTPVVTLTPRIHVFDAGNQLSVNGVPANFVDANTDGLWMVNTDGGGLQNLRGAIAGFPVWTPSGTTFCNLPGVVTPGGAPGSIDDCGPPIRLSAARTPSGQLHLDITGGVPNLLLRVAATTNLSNWQTIGTIPRGGEITPFTDTTAGPLPRRLYRIQVGNN